MPTGGQTQTVETPLEDVLLEPQTQAALTALLKELPRLAGTLQVMSRLCQAAEDALTDPEFMGGVEDMLRVKLRPWRERAREWREAVEAAKDRAERSTERIGVFGLLRLLRDPAVQRALRFAAALADELEQRRAERTDGLRTQPSPAPADPGGERR
ncbi:MAG: DUF1641 domain-containing protein [Thermoflavifilum sp.]|nr:DUF1641 domain-containing protein [Thermoflavifilum sp.]MCL6514851.1 DUF1641 domain-containing protein [Alicyclobacillus sp.]